MNEPAKIVDLRLERVLLNRPKEVDLLRLGKSAGEMREFYEGFDFVVELLKKTASEKTPLG